ncbi:MAG: T9SS type A sorting domain-containing protein, partial [Bacteroidales bacterium]|nr:T9SS type A sorting domain-containing protein [Bacteroidales bacterium]
DVQYLPADPVVWDLVVNIKTLTVSGATAADKTYDGTTDATVSGASLAGVVGADDVTLSGATTGTFAQADAGTGIAVSTSMTLSGLDIDNYGLELPVDITADITAKDLTVTADDKSREECAVNPEFTVTYSGFADAEDAGVLNSEAVASCSADETSAAGAYDITVTGGSADNYNLVYVTGTLTVTLDITVPMLTVQNVTVQLDDTDNAMITAADVVTSASDNCTIADTTLSQSSFTVNDIGDVTIDVTVTDMAGNETTETAVVTVEGATGIAKLDAFDTRFYPNPTDGMLYFDLDYPADELKVMDMTGKTIIKRSNLDKQDVIDLSEYNSGIYLIQLKSGEALLHFKVVRK